jgi:endonuclease/exonuclease/phosphatase family metal-dependent hydrolase
VIRVATYNIHAAVGTDGRRDLARIAAVIREIDPDVVGLQEVESRPSRSRHDQAEQLAEQLGMSCAEGPILVEGRGWYGNAILSRFPVEPLTRLRFADQGGEPRGALEVRVHPTRGCSWRIANTHLDVRAHRRLRQARALARSLAEPGEPGPWVLLGDFNEWRPRARLLASLRGLGELPAAPASYPSRWPLFAIDRMVLRGCRSAGPLRCHRSDLARHASDHLPIVADLCPVAGFVDASSQIPQSGVAPSASRNARGDL